MGMEYKISGVIQLVAVTIVSLYLFLSLGSKLYSIGVAVLFIIKGIGFTIFKQSLLSLLDTFFGIYLFFAVLGWFSNTVISIVAIVFLTQKGITYLLR